jgi:hypothetical protein
MCALSKDALDEHADTRRRWKRTPACRTAEGILSAHGASDFAPGLLDLLMTEPLERATLESQ